MNRPDPVLWEFNCFNKMPWCIVTLILLLGVFSVTSGVAFEKRVLESDYLVNKTLGLKEETSEIFNKTLASKEHGKFLRGARTPPTPLTRVMPSYSPPSRVPYFTPPVPPEYSHPFVNKPILRGSNSDSLSVGGRRPLPPPPPFKVLPPEEQIPIRPPDLPPSDTKKKTLNTPSFNKKLSDPSAYSETSSTTTSNARGNETFDFVPILPYTSVSRILSGASGRKHEGLQDIIGRTQIVDQDKESRTIKQEIVKSLIPPQIEDVVERKPSNEVKEPEVLKYPPEEVFALTDPPPKSRAEEVQEAVEDNIETEVVAPQSEKSEPRVKHVLGIAWEIHVYLIATLFALIALISCFNLVRTTYSKHLLSKGYYVSLHGFLLMIGSMRCFYLFYDAYNVRRSLPEPISNLLLHMVFPLLTSSFSVIFLFLLMAAEVKALNKRIQRASFLAIFIILHLGISFGIHLYADDTPYSMLLPLISQCVFIVLCVGLGVAYLYVYKSLAQSCIEKSGYGNGCERWSLAHAIRVTLATSMLSLLMAAIQLYGMLGVYEVLAPGRPQPWLWWGYQLSVRVIEVSMCALLCWAGMQKDSSSIPDQPASVEDIYPTICTANQAYTVRSTSKQYEDTFPLNSLHAHTTERRSIKKHPSLDRRLQPSPSMLVAENGFVRFRTIADTELPDEMYTANNSLHDFA